MTPILKFKTTKDVTIQKWLEPFNKLSDMMEEQMEECYLLAQHCMSRTPHNFHVGAQESIEQNILIKEMYSIADFFENGPFELIENQQWIERLDRLVDQTLAMEAFNQYDLIRKQKCPKLKKKLSAAELAKMELYWAFIRDKEHKNERVF